MDPSKSTLLMQIDQLCALVDQAKIRGVPTMMHHLSLESFRRGVRAGVTSLSHAPVDGLLTGDDIDSMKQAGCIIEPTCSTLYGVSWPIEGTIWENHPDMKLLEEYRERHYSFEDLAREYIIPELQSGVISSYQRFRDKKFKMFGMDMTPMLRYYADFTYMFENLRLLYEGGASIALANDAGVPPLGPAMMKLELDMIRYSIESGQSDLCIDGHDLIRIATLNSALSMGLEESYGSLDPGKVADIIVLDEDVIERPEALGSRVSALFIEGKLVIDKAGLLDSLRI